MFSVYLKLTARSGRTQIPRMTEYRFSPTIYYPAHQTCTLLTLLAGGPGELYTPPTFLHRNPMTHLHTFTISDRETTISDIFTYIPFLYHLRIDALNFSTPPPKIPPSAQRSAPLQSLHLNSFHLPPSTLHALLLLSRAVQTLHCLTPGHQLREPFGGSYPDSEMLEPLSAADIASGLRPARDSLVEL